MHVTVFKHEAVALLNLKKDAVVIDCTLGSGGHSKEILTHLGKRGVLLAIDADESAIEDAAHIADTSDAVVHLHVGNFRDVQSHAHAHEITKVDAILADLGWRIEQFEGKTKYLRGFSFKNDEPLSMTFGNPSKYSFTAKDIVNEWQEEDIANVIYAYGEDRFARRIAKAICEARTNVTIDSSLQLANIIEAALPKHRGGRKTHPATKTFQALRIAVNDEFDALRELLIHGFDLLHPGGRMAIITFHSLEDRIVKETFKNYTRDHKGVLVTKKPITPSTEELENNKRARSAKLRIIEKR